MEKLTIVKIGGNVIDNSKALHDFLRDFSAIPGKKILIHGGGKIATELSGKLGIEAQMVEGRRITDIETLRVVTMVYAGLINKNIVAQLQWVNCNAIGLTGADGNIIKAQKRPVKEIDYGYVGDLDDSSVSSKMLNNLLEGGFVPVFCAITHDREGQLLNTNADTIAAVIAVAMSTQYQTELVYCFEKKGVLKDVTDDTTVIRTVKSSQFENLKADGTIAGGMVPKLQNAFDAIHKGVTAVYIGKADELPMLNKGIFGTRMEA
ncbi:acetylglutamate kinase [Pedobacter sp.]|uniref:acetylglutamate kinase n=1 Tax=Pedobacter sp. TaxID=1411316 RepID=UPI00396C5A1D